VRADGQRRREERESPAQRLVRRPLQPQAETRTAAFAALRLPLESPRYGKKFLIRGVRVEEAHRVREGHLPDQPDLFRLAKFVFGRGPDVRIVVEDAHRELPGEPLEDRRRADGAAAVKHERRSVRAPLEKTVEVV